MARLAPSELAEVLEFLTPRPWVRPLAGIAAPGGIVPFVRHQLGDVRVDDRRWIATAPWEGIAVTGTPRLGARRCAAARVHLACSQSTGETGRRVHPTG